MLHRPNRIVVLGAALHACLLLAQTPPPSPYLEEEVRHLIGIQNRMRVSLEQLPNYTCFMEIRRAHLGVEAREKIAKKLEKTKRKREVQAGLRSERQRGREVEVSNVDIPLDVADVVALEVAVVDSKELYAFPDSKRFEDRSLASMIGHGTVSNGSFAGHARDIFVNGAPVTKYVGVEVIDGRSSRRYDYEVALFRSRYSVSNHGQTAEIPYFGSFWAAANTDELLRLTVSADDIPSQVGIDNVTTQIDYQTLQLDSQPFIVPQRSRLTMLLSTGVESVSETEYSNCRSFLGSSTLSFAESTPETFYVERVEEVQQINLPADLRLPVRLTTAIDSETARVGTLVEAELTRDVEIGPGLTAPQGAVLSGRLLQFEFYDTEAGHYVVGLQFRELTFDAGKKSAELSLELESLVETTRVQQYAPTPVVSNNVSQGVNGNMGTIARRTVETYTSRELPGAGVFYVHGRKFQLKPGLKMTWRTVAARD